MVLKIVGFETSNRAKKISLILRVNFLKIFSVMRFNSTQKLKQTFITFYE